ncbi:MAG: cold shock domain-containing protein [Thermoleophilaceae bacterium]|nr:cold shock domain-containing protein [Thermoleophilaceae bacterium]
MRWLSGDKGFGFITPDEVGKHLFVHHSGIAAEGLQAPRRARGSPMTPTPETRAPRL